ncbi:HD domain-containing protein [Aquimarina algiphila]|uniref:HD domain-containing protein n=1 Tax=Aquimarina algiphila TaxID=2047982 RepID=UPI00232F630F|nr:ATP-binding protein [Aquimarina algiphila]
MSNDYKDEYLLRLEKSDLYKVLKVKCEKKDSEIITLVNKGISYAFQRTKTIVKHMGEFTLHDGDHLFRVLNLMEKLIPKENIQNFSIPELAILILSSFFHDIGMAPDEKEILAWKKVFDYKPEIEEQEKEFFDKFNRFIIARPESKELINELIIKGKHSEAEIQKAYLITEYIRVTHAERAKDIIAKDWSNKIVFRDVDLTIEFAQICYSHNENALTLLDLDQNYLCGENIYSCLPLLGVILRLADILDFDAKRTPPTLFSHLNVRHPISIKEWNKHRAVQAWVINSDKIQFNAKCTHPAIEASIHEFCDLIDQELSICNNILSILYDSNQIIDRNINIRIPFQVDREKIQTQKDIHNKPLYIYRNTQFNLSKKQVIGLLMGTKLYGNPEVALRELLQNSIDACLLRKAQEDEWGNSYVPEISVKYYKEEGDIILEVDDNGTGMDQYIIDSYYSKIGSSFYKSTDFYDLKSKSNADFTPTSRFGIGILSCFMVADTLTVDTKRVYAPHKSSDAINITVEGQESIFWIKDGSREMPGTTTKLVLRKEKNPWDEMSENDFIKSIDNVIPNPPFQINIHTISEKKVKNESSFLEQTSISLKDRTWNSHDNIRIFEIELNKKELGFLGSVSVAILESQDAPQKKIELNSKDIEIEGDTYTLEKKITISENSISETSKTITINDKGEIDESQSHTDLVKSRSKLSLHGIEVPSTLFPNRWNLKNHQVRISWPFPLILFVDICGKRDLDLNSPRTEIIMSEKWIEFEEDIAFTICQKIANQVTKEYWTSLKEIFESMTENKIFLAGLTQVIK